MEQVCYYTVSQYPYGNNVPVDGTTIEKVPCSETDLPQFSDKKVKFVFGASSSSTYLDITVQGAEAAIDKIEMKYKGKTYEAEKGVKFTFNANSQGWKYLEKGKYVQFKAYVNGFQSVALKMKWKDLEKAGNVQRDQTGNQVNKEILDWPDIFDATD